MKYATVVMGIGLAALLALAACGGSAPQECGALCDSLTATAEALARPATETPVPPETAGGDSAESTPSQQPTATRGGVLATAQAEATIAAATRAAELVQATADAQAARQAQAAAEQPIRDALPTYGVNPDDGAFAWRQDGIELIAEGYQTYQWRNPRAGTVVRDFVLSADITWNTRFGTTGCGFVIRSDGKEESVNQYLVIATRGAQGHVLFVVQRDGEVIDDDISDIYASGRDPRFDWRNDTTNRLTVVGRGDSFTIFTNDTHIGTIDTNYGYLEGFVAFLALNESGDTTCRFNNAWLWLLDE